MKENCMLCQSGKIEDVPKDWIIETKLDGYRCLYVKGRLINRDGNDITNKFPEIAIYKERKTSRGVSYDVADDMILDGEIVVFEGGFGNNPLKTSFNMLQNHGNNPTFVAYYVVFDILEFKGENITSKPLRERLIYIPYAIKHSRNVLSISDLPILTWEEVKEKGYEGLIAKNPNSIYEFKRSKNWLKIKNHKEFIIKFNKYEINDDGSLTITDGNHRVKLAGSDNVKQFLEEIRKGDVTCEISGLEQTAQGHIRFPVFKRIIKK